MAVSTPVYTLLGPLPALLSRGAWTFPHVRERNEKRKVDVGKSRILVPAFHHRSATDDPSSPFHSVSPVSEFVSSEIPSGLNLARLDSARLGSAVSHYVSRYGIFLID